MRPPNNHNKCPCYYVGDDIKSEEEGTSSSSSHHPRCSVCVQRLLQPALDRHARAMEERDQARDECAQHLETLPDYHRLGELQVESEQLRQRLTTLRKQCGELAVRVASQAVENDSHRESTQQLVLSMGGMEGPQQQLERLEQSVLQGSLYHAIDVASKQVRLMRFQWARKALAMHRLYIDPNDVKLTPLQQRESVKTSSSSSSSSQGHAIAPRRARGIGKIGGLPLPHAGPELYGVLPPKELQSALRLVASVTCTVARCLGIVLPHPILLTPTTGGSPVGDITETVSAHELQRRLRENHHATTLVNDANPPPHYPTTTTTNISRGIPHDPPNPTGSNSLLSLMDTSYWKQSAKKALARATGHASSSLPSAFSTVPSTLSAAAAAATSSSSSISSAVPSMDSAQLSLRIHHATAAILAEDATSPNPSLFALSVDDMHQQDFAIALQLLQNDVIVLCIRTGVPVSKLWPAEALLLNLYQLDQYCQQQTGVTY